MILLVSWLKIALNNVTYDSSSPKICVCESHTNMLKGLLMNIKTQPGET